MKNKENVSCTLSKEVADKLLECKNKSKTIEEALRHYFKMEQLAEKYEVKEDEVLIPIKKYALLAGISTQGVNGRVRRGELRKFEDFIVLEEEHPYNVYAQLEKLQERVERLEG